MTDPVIAPAIGDIDGVNVLFKTPVAYYAGTVWLFRNGQLIHSSDDRGLIELGGVDIKLKVAPLVNDRIDFWFHTGPPTPGQLSTPPKALQAIVLQPAPFMARNLVPWPCEPEAGQDSSSLAPLPMKALELDPEAFSAVNLTPTPVDAKEV